jgi:hypothetical protein
VSARGVLRIVQGGRLSFWCAGCNEAHGIPVNQPGGWKFNGDYERPTFEPSILVTWAHPKGHTNKNPAPIGFPSQKDRPDLWTEERCHSFVRAGHIQFLGDCTHALAGKTVPLEPF